MRSKLPDVGTTIFTIMSRRAAELGAVNLGQGFPDYPIDTRLAELVADAMREGHNQYAPMPGVPALLEAIASRLEARYGLGIDPQQSITITLGATEAIYSSIQALAGPGDEVLVFDPSYDSYDPAVRLAGARCVHVPLAPPLFAYDWDAVRAAVNERTRLIIINSPQNPSCTVLGPTDLDQLAAIVAGRDIRVLSDEVYEHVVFDGRQHYSVLGHPQLRQCAVAVYSFGKALHATGLRVGYAVAPADITIELRKVHQFNTFTIATPLQHAIARYISERADVFSGLAGFFQSRRDLLTQLLAGSPLRVLPAAGSFFQLVDYSGCEALSALDDQAAAQLLLEQAGVATIPLSPFYKVPPAQTLLRLCFAKREETLREGASRLRHWMG
ncbi:MAG: methionine aminotransferase [Proteobacteria bacterium]|nr:methionine aminotransferase [Pseudomonadota bacterium]